MRHFLNNCLILIIILRLLGCRWWVRKVGASILSVCSLTNGHEFGLLEVVWPFSHYDLVFINLYHWFVIQSAIVETWLKNTLLWLFFVWIKCVFGYEFVTYWIETRQILEIVNCDTIHSSLHYSRVWQLQLLLFQLVLVRYILQTSQRSDTRSTFYWWKYWQFLSIV